MTATKEQLQSLLERVEKATGPDRELDALILCATLAPEGSKVEQSQFSGAWVIYKPMEWGKEPFKAWETPAPWRRWAIDGMGLSASIDAALALVERVMPGWSIEMVRTRYCTVEMWKADEEGFFNSGRDPIVRRTEGATPPLAILSALLKALISQSKEKGE